MHKQIGAVEYLKDGTRLSEAERSLLDFSHRQVLKDYNIDMVEITGDWDERFEKTVEQINKLIATNRHKQPGKIWLILQQSCKPKENQKLF